MWLMKLGSRAPHLCRPPRKLSYYGKLYKSATRNILITRERSVRFHPDIPSAIISFAMVGVEVNIGFLRPDLKVS